MNQSETTIASLFDGGASLLTSNIAILIFSLLTILIVYSVLVKDFSLLTTFASGLAGVALLGGVISVLEFGFWQATRRNRSGETGQPSIAKLLKKEKVLPRREWVFH